MKQKTIIKFLLLTFCLLTGSNSSSFGATGDILAKLAETAGSGYATRITKTDSYSVSWVLSGSSTGCWGSNNNQKANVKPTTADLPVVKGVTSTATTSTQYHYFYYTTTAVSNVGSIEFKFSNTYDTSTSCNVYIVMGDAVSASGGTAYTQVELSNTSATSQGASISSAGTYTFTFAETQTSAKYYGLVIKVANSSYKRFDNASLTLKEGVVKTDLTSFAFANPTANVTLSEVSGSYEAEYTQAVSFSPNTYTGTITYSIDEDASNIGENTMADVDEDGKVTVLASANEASTIVVKASGAATALHNAPADATYTLNVNAILAYTITGVANNSSFGSVEVSGPTITATPNADYKVASGTDGYTVISGTATVVNNGDNTFTVTPTTDCTIQVNFEQKPAPTFSFASATTDVNYGSDITEPLLSNNSSGTVTYSSSNTKVATVDENTGEVTAVAVGTTAITASITADATYCSASTSYTLTVNEYAATPALPSTETLFIESFNSCNGTGGNDGYWNGSIASAAGNTDQTGWALNNEGGGNKCLKLGTGSSKGSATTPAINLNSSVSYTLAFKAGAWDGSSETTTITVSIEAGGGEIDGETSQNVVLTKGEFNDFEYEITGAGEGTKIKWSAVNTKNNRFFLDEVKITAPTTPAVDVTVPASGWGTFCSPYALDLGNEATTVNAYAVSDYNATAGKVTFVKLTGKVPAKTPLVINGETGAKKIAVTEDETSAPAANILRGYLSPTYYAGADATETLMGMSGGEFKKVQAGTIPANRAVLVMATDDFNNIPDGSKLTFIIEDNSETDGINNHSINFVKYDGNAYNLAGQRVGNDYKGIVIVNGKKIVRK